MNWWSKRKNRDASYEDPFRVICRLKICNKCMYNKRWVNMIFDWQHCLLYEAVSAFLIDIGWIYRVFIKNCVFPQKVVIFLNSVSSAASLVFYLPGVCIRTDTEGKQKKTRVRNILKSFENTQYLMNTLYNILLLFEKKCILMIVRKKRRV